MNLNLALIIHEGVDAAEHPSSEIGGRGRPLDLKDEFDAAGIRVKFVERWREMVGAIRLQSEPFVTKDDVVIVPGAEITFQLKLTLAYSGPVLITTELKLIEGIIMSRVMMASTDLTGPWRSLGPAREVDPVEAVDQLVRDWVAIEVMGA